METLKSKDDYIRQLEAERDRLRRAIKLLIWKANDYRDGAVPCDVNYPEDEQQLERHLEAAIDNAKSALSQDVFNELKGRRG